MERFLDLYKEGWKKYACFKGRACRAELLAFLFTHTLILALLWLYFISRMAGALLGFSSLSKEFGLLFFVSLIFCLAIIIPSCSIIVRRLHDLNKSGWLWLLVIALYYFIPYLIVGEFILFVFLFILYVAQGTEGNNKYGPESDLY